MKKIATFILVVLALLGLSKSASAVEVSNTNKEYRLVWSHYTTWELCQYMADSGIMAKWNKICGVNVKVEFLNDYVGSINLYTAGDVVGCTMTEMDLLNMPAAGGVDSDVLIVQDYSDGNDGICLVNGKTMADIKGREINIVQGSVSSFLLSEGLKANGMKDSDVKEVNTSDANMAAAFAASGDKGACATWNPILMQVRNLPKVNMVFDSSKIPGKIQDLMVVRHDAPDAVKKAVVGAWFEAMAVMVGQGKPTDEAIEAMAKFAGGTVAEFKAQIKTTHIYKTTDASIKFAESTDAKTIAKEVAEFCFDHGLMGSAKSATDIGWEFPDGTIYGNSKNIKIHYRTDYMKMIEAGKL